MTQKAQNQMTLGAGGFQINVGEVAAGTSVANSTFTPILVAQHKMRLDGFRHYASATDAAATVSVKIGPLTGTLDTVSLTGGDDTPSILTTVETESTDNDGGTFSSSTTNYVAKNDAVQIIVDNSGGSSPVQNLVVEVYFSETDQ